jgi:glutaredoxin
MQINFYDKNGKPTAYTEDGIHIYLFSGEAVGYLDGDSVFSYLGVHLGWFEDNWIRDHSGNCVFFTDETTGGGPVRPTRGVKPLKSVKSEKPTKGIRQVKPVKAGKSLFWSRLTAKSFFHQRPHGWPRQHRRNPKETCQKEKSMKQQCHISFVYGSWLVLFCGMAYFLFRGEYLDGCLWAFLVGVFLWLYIRYFPSLSRYMGYGSVEDNAPNNIQPINARVVLYTGVGCPFCPIVRRRLRELQHSMGFELEESDVTLRPELIKRKGIRALPVIEVGDRQWIGNATSDQLVTFIAENSSSGSPVR